MEENQTINIGTLVEPEPIGFSFDAPGWGIILGILFLFLVIIVVKQILKYRKNKYRRIAISKIEELFKAQMNVDQLVFQVAQILKRVSISSFGRDEVAHLNGMQWLEFLSRKNDQKPVFSPSLEKVFSESLYQGSKANLDSNTSEELKNTSINWINKHHV